MRDRDGTGVQVGEVCRIVDAAYERRSVALTSNLHPSGFDTIMPETLATATVDRLLHNAHVVFTTRTSSPGTSLRLIEATACRLP
jgi:DNA replication protein DnaC